MEITNRRRNEKTLKTGTGPAFSVYMVSYQAVRILK